MRINDILKKLPPDFIQDAVRDVSLPTSAVFVDVHAKEIPKRFGAPFRALFMYQYKNQAGIFRSSADMENFSKKSAVKFLRDKKFTGDVIKKIVKYTKWMSDFIRNNPKAADLIKSHKIFFAQYREFFTYHQIIQWGGDYLAKMEVSGKDRQKRKQVSRALQKAYQFNEMVVPLIEKYFRKLKIQHLLPEEINANLIGNIKAKPKGRNVLILKNRRVVLTAREAKVLKEGVDRKIQSSLKKTDELHGLKVSSGTFIGKVRVIKELAKLGTVKPGEILVTTMTRPQYNPVLKKIGALVTDEGGMVSHAAILSREYKIPCVTGTKIATKIFKDGDIVEVNANHGWVKKLNG
jgi:phosphohistidine swiveling domain-containing protein